MMIFAGVGSRETPPNVCHAMRVIGHNLTKLGHLLRSGGARGADQAFEEHALLKEIWYASDAQNHWHWFPHAGKYHPVWSKLSPYAKELMARNSAIMCGEDLLHPVDFVICWTKDGGATGGTGQALRIASDLNIPVFNLFFPDAEQRMMEFVK